MTLSVKEYKLDPYFRGDRYRAQGIGFRRHSDWSSLQRGRGSHEKLRAAGQQ